MEAKGHAGIVAGLSSVAVTGFVRHRVRDMYDPEVTSPPSMTDRLRKRAPMAIAGLGFTGLSTKIAAGFDGWELELVSDTNSKIPPAQQLGGHRSLHSIPYVVVVHQTAHLVKNGAAKLGEWLGSKLQIPDRAEEITSQLEALADWVIDSFVIGAIGHLLGDLPTSGYGGTALQLMAPLTDRNFSLGWIKADSTLNSTFWKWGLAIAGAAWATSGTYLASWKPPETKVREYLIKLRDCESFSSVLKTIEADIERLFKQVLDDAPDRLWDLPLFKNQNGDVQVGIHRIWFQQHIDSGQVFGISGYNREILVEKGIWSEAFESPVASSLISTDTDRGRISLSSEEVINSLAKTPLETVDAQSDHTSLTGENPSGKSLIQSDDDDTPGLFTEDHPLSGGSSLSTDRKNETSLVADDDTEGTGTPLQEDPEKE